MYQRASDAEARVMQLERDLVQARDELASRSPPGARTEEVVSTQA